MKIWGKLLLFYLFCMIVTGYFFNSVFQHFSTDTLELRTKTQKTAYSSVLQSDQVLADTFFNEVLNQEKYLSIVNKIIHSEGDEQSIQRGLLYRSLVATYDRNKGNLGEILHFVFPDNRSMLRFHMPQKANDSLTELRHSIAKANTSLASVHGFESGRIVHGYRHVYPLIYHGNHIGSVEVSSPYHNIYRKVQHLETASKTQFVFFVKGAHVVDKLFKGEEQFYVNDEISPDYTRLRFHRGFSSESHHREEMTPEIISILKKVRSDNHVQNVLAQGGDISIFTKQKDKHCSVVFHPVLNVAGKNSGYLVGITPEPNIQKILGQFWLLYFLSGAILLGILVYRGMLQIALVQKQKNEESLQAFFDNQLIGMVRLNSEGLYRQVNQQWQSMTGYSRDELLSMHNRQLTYPEDFHQETLLDQFLKSKGNKTLHLEKRYVRKDGSVFWGHISGTALFDSAGKLAGMVAMIVDITEQKQNFADLEMSERRLSLALKAGKSGLWDWNIKDNTTYFDPNFYLMVGYEPDEFPHHFDEWKKRVHPDDRAAAKMAIQQYLVGEITAYAVEYRFKTKSHGWMWIADHGEIVEWDEEGHPARLVGLHVDITERKQGEIQQQDLEEQLRQKFKMEAVGVMAGGMAHNFNNNLSIILGNLDLAKLKQAENSESIPLLDNAKTAVFRARDLIRSLLTYSRKGTHEKSIIQPVSVVNETISLLRSTIPTTVDLQQIVNPESKNATIYADASQIQEALFNLCNNAVHAMDEQGELSVFLDSVELESKDIPAQFSCHPGDYVRLRIQDDGCGITASTMDKIFDPFFTTKEVGEGTGMGLSTVMGIVTDHSGLVTVNSSPGQGTCFDLCFPLTKEKLEIIAPQKEIDLPRGTEQILFVDDDEMLATLGGKMLTEVGYKVAIMTDSTEALKLFVANSDSIDLVITDQTMPKLTGRDLIQKLLKIRPDLPTIICTGHSKQIDKEKAQELGASAFCMKPLDLSELLQTTRRVLDQAKAR